MKGKIIVLKPADLQRVAGGKRLAPVATTTSTAQSLRGL